MLKEKFKELQDKLLEETKSFYGNRLVSFVVFGSVARETYRFNSDIDLLIIAENLPKGRMKRVAELGSPLFLDMVEDARILYDKSEFFSKRLERLRKRLRELGAKRVWKGNIRKKTKTMRFNIGTENSCLIFSDTHPFCD